MTAPTELQELEIRAWVGPADLDDVTPSKLTALFEAYGHDVNLTARSVLRTRRADLCAGAIKFSLEGDTSEDNSANLKALDADIAALSKLIDGSTIPGDTAQAGTLGCLTRVDRERLFS